MRHLGDIRRHFFLTIGMARRRGIDLGEALTLGRITRTEYADHVTRCRSCAAPDTCEALMAKCDRLADVPDFCENRAAFARLSVDG